MNEQTKKKILVVEILLLLIVSLITILILYSNYNEESLLNKETKTGLHVDIKHNDTYEEPEYKIAFTATTNHDHLPLSYYWEFGDGSTSTEKNPTHSYSTAGLYQIQVTVTDSYGNTGYDKILVNSGDTDALEAEIKVNTWSGFEPLIIYFHASSNKENETSTYDWEFGPAYRVIVPFETYQHPGDSFRILEKIKKRQHNIQQSQYSSNKKNPTMVFCYEGLYWAKLTITDEKGNSAVDKVWIQVYDNDLHSTVLQNIFNK